jgi:hypothetical protein
LVGNAKVLRGATAESLAIDILVAVSFAIKLENILSIAKAFRSQAEREAVCHALTAVNRISVRHESFGVTQIAYHVEAIRSSVSPGTSFNVSAAIVSLDTTTQTVGQSFGNG